MLGNMTIKARLILLVSAIMAVIVFNQVVSYYATANLQSATQDLADRRIRLIRLVNGIMYHAGRSACRGYGCPAARSGVQALPGCRITRPASIWTR